jgi:hypothetical protein
LKALPCGSAHEQSVTGCCDRLAEAFPGAQQRGRRPTLARSRVQSSLLLQFFTLALRKRWGTHRRACKAYRDKARTGTGPRPDPTRRRQMAEACASRTCSGVASKGKTF